jgi:hypothetical protein
MSALETERRFFTALTQADALALEEILAPDLSMVALNGSVLDRASLTGAIGSGHLKFHEIQVIEAAKRFYPPLAVIVGPNRNEGQRGRHAV